MIVRSQSLRVIRAKRRFWVRVLVLVRDDAGNQNKVSKRIKLVT